ncbi:MULTISPECIES: pyruvate:ferredoxin (flavodoxin) oxidoreductase, partial [Clostridium]
GALTTSYTASQGLLLMIPTMYRIAGMLKPSVIHVAARSVATQAFSIFGEHSDVMACRQIGYAMLASSNVQEAMDLGAVAHLATIEGKVPFIHFFDGFRTSHEIQKIDCLDYNDLANLVDKDALEEFRKGALNPEHPVCKSTGQNPEIFFENREACNVYYDNLPAIVEKYMGKINELTGRNYKLFNYYGADDAKYVIMAMGSVNEAAKETVDYLNAKGEKVGLLEVHLYRPFSIDHFLRELPKTVEKIAVLDRTKEPGAVGEPLYQDVCSAYNEIADRPQIFAGRFGLGGKDTTPAHIVAIYENLKKKESKNHFTVGIVDDLTFHSIEIGESIDIVPKGTISCKFWGLGSDGTVGANKNSIKIIGDHTDKYVQAYFEYDGKKSGGITVSHLRFGDKEIRSTYLVKKANFIACHNQSYLKKYDMISDLNPGGIFLLNCNLTPEELETNLPYKFKKYAAKNKIKFYTIDATAIAKEIGLGSRTNTVLQAAFFKLANIIPTQEAVKYMKGTILKTYGKKGDKVINMNYAAVDKGIEGFVKVDVPQRWATDLEVNPEVVNENLPTFVKELLIPVNTHNADNVPVSTFKDMADGTVPAGTSKYEKRGIAIDVPVWIKENCIQCNQCSFVCPHASIRPFLASKDEASNAPSNFETIDAKGKGLEDYKYKV